MAIDSKVPMLMADRQPIQLFCVELPPGHEPVHQRFEMVVMGWRQQMGQLKTNKIDPLGNDREIPNPFEESLFSCSAKVLN